MNKVSIILPSIRTKNLLKWYNAAEQACQNHSWEVVIVSPYNLPSELENKDNIKFIKSNRNALVCKQMGILLCNAEFLFNTTDDALLLPNSIDKMIDLWNRENLNEYDVINGRYREGALDADTLLPLENIPPELPQEYWYAGHHASLQIPGIHPKWKTCLHFFMRLDDFYDLGGLNCNDYEYSVYPILELMFLCQRLGGRLIESETEVSWCSHLPCLTGDHAPVHWAMINDEQIFREKFKHKSYKKEDIIELNNYNTWKRNDKKWQRRF